MIKEKQRKFVIETLAFGFLFVLPCDVKSIDYTEYCPDSLKQVHDKHIFLSKQIAYSADDAVSACNGFNGNLFALNDGRYDKQKMAYVWERFNMNEIPVRIKVDQATENLGPQTGFVRRQNKLNIENERTNDIVIMFYNFLDTQKLRVVFKEKVVPEGLDPIDFIRYRYLTEYIYLLARPIEGYTRRLTFCKAKKSGPDAYDDKWEIRQDGSCQSGWIFDFFAYDGNESSEGVWKYYHYTTSLNSSYISRTPLNNYSINSDLPAIYSNRYEAFIGVRSDYNETEWTRPDGSLAQSLAPKTNSSISQCEQAVMYHDQGDFTSYAVPCYDNIPKFFFCEMHIQMSAHDKPTCDTADVYLTWSMLDNILQNTRNNLTVNAYLNGINKRLPFYDGGVYFYGLPHTTSFEANMTVKSERCSVVEVFLELKGITGFDSFLPEPVSNSWARDTADVSKCIIRWEHSNDLVDEYEIRVNENLTSYYYEVNSSLYSRYSKRVLQFSFDTTELPSDMILSVEIRPFGCNVSGNYTQVNGLCGLPPRTTTTYWTAEGSGTDDQTVLIVDVFAENTTRKGYENTESNFEIILILTFLSCFFIWATLTMLTCLLLRRRQKKDRVVRKESVSPSLTRKTSTADWQEFQDSLMYIFPSKRYSLPSHSVSINLDKTD